MISFKWLNLRITDRFAFIHNTLPKFKGRTYQCYLPFGLTIIEFYFYKWLPVSVILCFNKRFR